MPEILLFAIQSIGMTTASIYILNKKNEIGWHYIRYVTLFGLPWTPGWYLVLFFLHRTNTAKLIFVSLWFWFWAFLWWQNKIKTARLDSLPITKNQRQDVIIHFGFMGGFDFLIIWHYLLISQLLFYC